jgi:DNA-damage-inducible protein D
MTKNYFDCEQPMSNFDITQFEDSSRQNGVCYWYAHEFMQKLGYETWQSFISVIRKAMASCSKLGIDSDEVFIAAQFMDDQGKQHKTYKLTRFACFLITMYADDKKPQVTQAKIALSAIAAQLVAAQVGDEDLGRIDTREDIKAAEKLLSGVARTAGVDNDNFGLFRDSGYRGMYNMSLAQLKKYKGIDQKNTAYDFMGLTELAGNLFRVTQTAERMKNNPSMGLRGAIETAKDVGQEVRGIMIKNSGIHPEDLETEEHINKAKSRLKNTNKKMLKQDKK